MLKRSLISGETGRVVEEVDVLEVRELLPSLWVPWRIRNQLFDHDGKKVADALLQVREMQINDLAALRSSFTPRAGSLEVTHGTTKQVAAGGHDLLDETINRLKRLGRNGKDDDAFDQDIPFWHHCMISAVAVVIVVTGSQYYWSCRPRAESQG